MLIRQFIPYATLGITRDLGYAILKLKIRLLFTQVNILIVGIVLILMEHDILLSKAGFTWGNLLFAATATYTIYVTVIIFHAVSSAYRFGDEIAERDFHDHISGCF